LTIITTAKKHSSTTSSNPSSNHSWRWTKWTYFNDFWL